MADVRSPDDLTEPTSPLEDALGRRLEVPARVGEPVTPELVAAYSNLLLYSANMTGVKTEELRLYDLLAQITARFVWPHPMRRATDRPAWPVRRLQPRENSQETPSAALGRAGRPAEGVDAK